MKGPNAWFYLKKMHVALNNGPRTRERACRGPRLRWGQGVKGEAGGQQAQLQVSGLISSLINNLSLGCRCRAGRAMWSRAFYVHFENKRSGCENWNVRVSLSWVLWHILFEGGKTPAAGAAAKIKKNIRTWAENRATKIHLLPENSSLRREKKIDAKSHMGRLINQENQGLVCRTRLEQSSVQINSKVTSLFKTLWCLSSTGFNLTWCNI